MRVSYRFFKKCEEIVCGKMAGVNKSDINTSFAIMLADT
jgi:hypothetical protein